MDDLRHDAHGGFVFAVADRRQRAAVAAALRHRLFDHLPDRHLHHAAPRLARPLGFGGRRCRRQRPAEIADRGARVRNRGDTLMPGLDLVPIWTAILAIGVFLYVALDGFDLGVGMLYNFAPDRDARALVMNSIAPIWDGNETWLILGSVGLLAAFPVAFAIIIPAVYFPILLMLLALIFRGLAFEFRYRDAEHRTFWDHGFAAGSALAAFAQGVVLGSFIQGFQVEGRHFVGGSFDCFTPFSIFTGIALMFGYGLLGAGWLVIKTEGALQAWARRAGRVCLICVLAAILAISIWTPLLHPAIAARWFGWPNLLLLAPVPIVTVLLGTAAWRALGGWGGDAASFLAGMG